MNILHEMFYYHTWATLQLIDFCARQTPAMLQELVTGTDRSIQHTLTHLIGSEQEYLELLVNRQLAPAIRPGEILSLAEIRRRCEEFSRHWGEALDGLAELDLTLAVEGSQPAIPHAQNVLVIQALQHGIDHRTQISTTLTTLGLTPPSIDGWAYWFAKHSTGA